MFDIDSEFGIPYSCDDDLISINDHFDHQLFIQLLLYARTQSLTIVIINQIKMKNFQYFMTEIIIKLYSNKCYKHSCSTTHCI